LFCIHRQILSHKQRRTRQFIGYAGTFITGCLRVASISINLLAVLLKIVIATANSATLYLDRTAESGFYLVAINLSPGWLAQGSQGSQVTAIGLEGSCVEIGE
jgi:hypothetical protein